MAITPHNKAMIRMTKIHIKNIEKKLKEGNKVLKKEKAKLKKFQRRKK